LPGGSGLSAAFHATEEKGGLLDITLKSLFLSAESARCWIKRTNPPLWGGYKCYRLFSVRHSVPYEQQPAKRRKNHGDSIHTNNGTTAEPAILGGAL
jgi:hypothetical protein